MPNIAEYQRKYREEHKDKAKAYRKIWYQKNKLYIKESKKEYMKKYYLKNKAKILEKSKNYKKLNKETIKKRNKIYYSNNATRLRAKHKEYYNKTKVKRIIKRLKYLKLKRKTSINFKLKDNLRRRVNGALKGKDKATSTLELIGCSIEFLKQHLEKQFTEAMTWETHGYYGWHIDHIKPCASFDLSKPEEQKKCFHYTNLQPLWGIDNITKGNKIKKEFI